MYLFHGSNVEKVRTKAFAWVAAARAKEPNLAYVRLAREELTHAALEDAALSGGLFVKRLLILLDDPYPPTRAASDDDEADENVGHVTSDILDDHLDALVASDNAIVVLAPKLSATKAKKLSAKAKIEYTFNTPAARETARGFNAPLVDALANRSREKLWLEINRALAKGDAPEMLHGLLHWKARDLMSKGGRVWTPQESRQLSLDLIELLQASRRGGLELGMRMEKWALSV